MQVQKISIHWTNGKQRMHLKKRFPFNESNVIKKKLQKTGKYMYGRQVDIKKICVGHVDFFVWRRMCVSLLVVISQQIGLVHLDAIGKTCFFRFDRNLIQS